MAKLSANGTEVARVTTPAGIEWDTDGRHWATWSEFSVRDNGRVLVNRKHRSFGPGCPSWRSGTEATGWKVFHDFGKGKGLTPKALIIAAKRMADKTRGFVKVDKYFDRLTAPAKSA